MKKKGSIIADEIVNEWHREKYYKELWQRNREKEKEEKKERKKKK